MAAAPVRDAIGMIAGMEPRLRPGRFVFAVSDRAEHADHALALIREEEGTTVVLEESVAASAGLDGSPAMACITLGVHSALDGVGLTAAVSTALAQAGIACNVLAGYHHDHLFVPAGEARRALEILRATQDAAPE